MRPPIHQGALETLRTYLVHEHYLDLHASRQDVGQQKPARLIYRGSGFSVLLIILMSHSIMVLETLLATAEMLPQHSRIMWDHVAPELRGRRGRKGRTSYEFRRSHSIMPPVQIPED